MKKGRLPAELVAAISLYERLDYEAALEQLARAKLAAWDPDTRVLAWLYEGIILANLGHVERSREAFRAGLRIQPSSVLPIAVSPKIAQFFLDVRADLQRETSSPGTSVSILSEPIALVPSQPSPPEAPPTPPAGSIADPPLVTPPAQQEKSPSPPSAREEAALSPPLSNRDALAPETSRAEVIVSQQGGSPWAPTAPPKPGESDSVKGHQVALALGGVIAVTGIVLLAAQGSAHPEVRSTHTLAGGLSIVSGLGFIAFGTITAQGQHNPKPARSVQRQRASVSAHLSF